jgi:hypothetical protein
MEFSLPYFYETSWTLRLLLHKYAAEVQVLIDLLELSVILQQEPTFEQQM